MTAMPTRQCNRCELTKPVAEFYAKGRGYLHAQCKACEADARQESKPIRRLPLTRAECEAGPRPCVHVSCRHHLYLEVTGHGRIVLNYPGLEPDELTVSCSLDVAADGEAMTLEAVGELTGIGRERVRQVEEVALRKLKRLPVARRLRGLDQ